MTQFDPDIIYAAGAVCWRRKGDKILVLVIHRTQRKDYSFPKGKVDPGELLPETCVREIAEETGFSISLGVPAGVTEYTMPSGKHKVVHYWTAQVSNKTVKRSTFVANDEVDGLEWLTIEKARKRLSYDPDRVILDNFESLAIQGGLNTFALIVLRHAKALDPATFVGKDQTRPLSDRGRRQAQDIVLLVRRRGDDIRHLRLPKRDRAGFIQNHQGYAPSIFQRFAIFKEDPLPCSFS